MQKFTFFYLFILNFLPSGAQIFFSEYAEGTSYNKYIEIYNYSSETVSLYPQFVLASCTNGCLDGNGFYINEFPEDAVIAPGDVYVVAANQADQIILDEADYTFQYCCGNGDDAYALMLAGTTGSEFDSSNALDIIGNEDTWQENIGWDVAGVEGATKNHTLVRKSSVLESNAGAWSSSAGTNLENSEWLVLEIDDWSNIGFHIYDDTTVNIFGCTDPMALNFNPNANIDDGSCDYDELYVSGCYWCELAANYFDFNAPNTGNNMTIAISDTSDLIDGDVIGVFYVDSEGFINCGGSANYEGGQLAIAAWGDDPSTFDLDGFSNGDSFIFLVFRNDLVYETSTILSDTAPFTTTYGNNNFAQISSFSITSTFVEECVLPLGVDEDCNEFFDILENQSLNRQLVLETDLFGRIINTDSKSRFYFRVYDDGTIEKKYYLNQ